MECTLNDLLCAVFESPSRSTVSNATRLATWAGRSASKARNTIVKNLKFNQKLNVESGCILAISLLFGHHVSQPGD